jgi:hypothetical protein
LITGSGTGASADCGQAEILCTFAASAPVTVLIELDWTLAAPAGTPIPLVQVDLGNNGTLEHAGTQPNTTRTIGRLQLGTTPLAAVVRLDSPTWTPPGGPLSSSVTLRVRPDHGQVIMPSTPPCAGARLVGDATFGGDLLLAVSPHQALQFLVVGLAAQPIPLPTAAPCLLMPARDAIVPFSGSTYLLPMANLHGMPLWDQVVTFTAGAAARARCRARARRRSRSRCTRGNQRAAPACRRARSGRAR